MLRIVTVVLAITASCGDCRLEKDFFFKHPAETRLERMTHYSLEDQYRIFRYGNDQIEPPTLELAKPIALRGAAAVPFLVDQLQSSEDDMTVRDILLVFQAMCRFQSYDVKNNASLMQLLDDRISKMKDKEWQAYCRKYLQWIKDCK